MLKLTVSLRAMARSMMKSTWLVATLVIALGMAQASAQSAEDQKLEAFFKQYLDEHFRQRPLDATQLGDHRFDNLLDDISPAARAGWTSFTRKTLKELPQQVNYAALSRDGQIDFEIFQHELEK